uniref:Uncharacterized protein n=1 Tax=Anguilla anguilla TaxID=7936 RepID=A0A0E9R4R4_ANGAN
MEDNICINIEMASSSCFVTSHITFTISTENIVLSCLVHIMIDILR